MAKKGSITRTDQVREYVSNNPDHTISETKSALKKQGIKVSRSLISQARKSLGVTQENAINKKATKKRIGKKKASKKTTPSTTRSSTSQVITADEVYDAKQLADELGGIDRLREALNALERLR